MLSDSRNSPTQYPLASGCCGRLQSAAVLNPTLELNMMYRLLLAAAALTLMLCAVSCKAAKFYTVGVMNRNAGDIQDVTIEWGKDTMRFGNIMEGRNATKTPFFSKPPATIRLSWKIGDQACAMDINMVDLIPDGFDGTIYLVIKGPESVGVGAVKEGDREGYKLLSDGK